MEGGAAVALCEAPRPLGGSWGDDGNIVASLTGVLARIPASGGTPVPVTKLNEGDWWHGLPQVLPGSQTVLFTVARIGLDYYDSDLDTLSLNTGERKTIQRAVVSGRYLASPSGSNGTGHLIYLRHATLYAVPFHLGSLSISGSPAPVLEDVSSTCVAGGDYAFGQNGTFLYPARVAPWVWPIMWVDRSGEMQPLHATPGEYFFPALSPDGKRLAFSADNGKGQDIWVKDLERDTLSQLTLMRGTNSHAVWTPDGKRIIFRSTTAAAPGLYGTSGEGLSHGMGEIDDSVS